MGNEYICKQYLLEIAIEVIGEASKKKNEEWFDDCRRAVEDKRQN